MTRTRPTRLLMIAVLALAITAAGCSDDDAETTTTATSPAPPTTSAPVTTPPPTSAAPTTTTAVPLTACEQYLSDLNMLSVEFVELVDEGNRTLLLTIGLETPYQEGSTNLDGVATRLLEIAGEIRALGDPPPTLATRVDFMLQSIEQFAEGYAEGAGAAAAEDAIALNRSLTTVSFGTGLMDSASTAPARCPAA